MERRYVALVDGAMGKTAKQITCLLATYLSTSRRTAGHTLLLYITNFFASLENRVLRRIVRPKRNKVTRERRKLHTLYSSLNIK